MFTWICPQCGGEVLPSQSECPACADRAKAAAQPPAPPVAPIQPPPIQPTPQYAPPPQYAQPAAPQQYAPQYGPPPQYAQPPQQQFTAPPPAQQYTPVAPPPPQFGQPAQQPYTPPPMQYGPPPSKGLPQWLVMLLVAGGMLGAGFLAYKYLLPSSRSATDDAETVATETPKTGGKKSASGKVHAYAKNLELAGVRLSEDARQRLVVKLTVINHSAADMSGLKLLVTVKTKGKGAATLSEVPMEVASLGPLESKDVTATVPTKLRAYELPDWQFLDTSFEITAP